MPEFHANNKARGDGGEAVNKAHEGMRAAQLIKKGADGRFIKGHKSPGQWKPGQSGNPIGRVKEKLSQQFIKALAQDFEKHGQSAVERARVDNPVAYLALVIKAVPPEAHQSDRSETLTPKQCKEELAKLLDELGYERKVAGDIVSEQ